jgi:DNA-binding transcriptional regulator YhcF (GntR family)
MAKALNVDWGTIRVLHARGEPITEIAKRFKISANTVYARSYKEKWAETAGIVKRKKDEATKIASDLWSERREQTRQKIFKVGEKMLDASVEMPGNELLTKADKVKIATEIAAKSVGLDSEGEKQTFNINLLSQIVENQPIDGTIQMVDRENAHIESVYDATTYPTTVVPDQPALP